MKPAKICHCLGVLLVCLLLLALPALAQQASKPAENEEIKRVADMARNAQEEGNKFREAGGKPGDANDPARKWAARFWQYREEHPGTAAGARATYIAIAWMLFAHQYEEVIAKTEKLPPDDPAWERVIRYLRAAAANKGDSAYFLKKANSLLQETKDRRLRATIRMELGRAYLDQDQPDQAKAAFQAVVEETPNSDLAKAAEANIYELTGLRVGQASPRFEAKALDGAPISSTDLRGKVVLLNFWGPW